MSAILSEDRVYRYTLWRDWPMLDGEERQGFGRKRAYAMFVGLNPSTADEIQDDPTIRRCVGFANAWGYGALCMTNLFAFRATNPKEMMAAKDPIGPDNDTWIEDSAREAGIIIAAWGKHGHYLKRDEKVIVKFSQILRTDFKCFGRNKDGSPRHPLYLPKDAKPIPFWKETSQP